MELIVALGNPGKEYEHTRHNIAWSVLSELITTACLPSPHASSAFSGDVSVGNLHGKEVRILFPTTFMNNSGSAVKKALACEPAASLIVVHDEIDLPFGTVRIAEDRGAGGHNGVKSIIESLGSQNFIRIRIGIGFNVDGLNTIDCNRTARHISQLQRDRIELAEALGEGKPPAHRQLWRPLRSRRRGGKRALAPWDSRRDGRRRPYHEAHRRRHSERRLVEALLVTQAMGQAQARFGAWRARLVTRCIFRHRGHRHRTRRIARAPLARVSREGGLRKQECAKKQAGGAQQGTSCEHVRILA